MLFPERFNFNNNLFDDFFTDPVFNMTTTNRMSTDIKEKDNGYELAMEVPGFNKEDLKLDLEDGYLTISAEHNTTNEEKDNEGHIMCKFMNDSRDDKHLLIEKGQGMVQGIFMSFGVTVDDDANDERTGGIGSTTK